MTALDIFAALGEVSDETLSETQKHSKFKGVRLAPISAAAACLIICAAAVHFINRDEPYSIPEIPETGVISSEQSIFSETESSVTSEISEEAFQSEPPITAKETANETTAVSTEAPKETTTVPTDTTPPTETVTSPTETDSPEGVLIPHWEDLSDLDKYIYLTYNGTEYSITSEKFPESELSFLCGGEIFGIDEYDVNGEKIVMPCGFYEISGISPEYMIAVPTADGKYTGYVNFSFTGDDLGDYLEKTNFFARYPLTGLYSGEICDGHDYYEYELPDLYDAVNRILLSDKSAVAEINPPQDTGETKLVIKSGGSTVVYIYEKGYVRFVQRSFYIGEDKCSEFIAYAEENASSRFVEYTRSENTEIIPE